MYDVKDTENTKKESIKLKKKRPWFLCGGEEVEISGDAVWMEEANQWVWVSLWRLNLGPSSLCSLCPMTWRQLLCSTTGPCSPLPMRNEDSQKEMLMIIQLHYFLWDRRVLELSINLINVKWLIHPRYVCLRAESPSLACWTPNCVDHLSSEQTTKYPVTGDNSHFYVWQRLLLLSGEQDSVWCGPQDCEHSSWEVEEEGVSLRPACATYQTLPQKKEREREKEREGGRGGEGGREGAHVLWFIHRNSSTWFFPEACPQSFNFISSSSLII